VLKDTPPISVACVGAGYFSQFHINAWHRLNAVDLVGIADPATDSQRVDGVPVFTSLAALLNHSEPTVIDLITPPSTHSALIEEALRCESVQAIICQKPFCLSIEEAANAVSAAKNANKILLVHENFRFQPWYRFIKEQLSDGLIGDALQLTLRLRPGDGQGPDAYRERQPYFQTMPRLLIHETGVHYIDVFRFLFGEPTSLYADLRRLNPAIKGEDAGYVVFEYEHGVRALLDGNRLLDHAAENLRCTMAEALVEGTTGTLSLHGDGSVWHRRFHEMQAVQLFTAIPSDQFGGDCAYHLQHHVVQHLVNGTALENTAEEYLSVLHQEQLVYQSSAEGRKLMLSH